VWNTFLAGLAVVLPVAITLYLIYWLATTSEAVLGSALQLVLSSSLYRPGMGLVAGFILVLLVGLLIKAYAVRWFLRRGEELLTRVPLVKSIYNSVKDFTRFLPAKDGKRDLQRVVLWKIGKGYIMGFVTADHVSEQVLTEQQEAHVVVYFPLGFQIGGHTVILPRSELIESRLSVEEALRMILTGGMTGSGSVLSSERELRSDTH
jgi:uncharacterized membrane protein